MRRVITGILCCLLVIFLMSHNTFAIDYTQNVRMVRVGIGSVYDVAQTSAYCVNQTNHYSFGNRNSITNFNSSNACSTTTLGLYAGYNEFLAGDIVQIDLIFNQLENNNSLDSWMYNISTSSSSPFILSKVEMEDSGASTSIVHYYFLTGRYTTDSEIYLVGLFNLPPSTVVSGGPVSTWRIESADYSSITNALDDVVEAIQDSAESSSEYQEAEEQAVENIENQTTSDTASQMPDMSSATSLIGNISNIFTQIGNIQPSNCTIPANWGNLNLGNISLCTGKENLPFVVTFGAYAFELIFVIGASIILVKQVVSMFDWARGDN